MVPNHQPTHRWVKFKDPDPNGDFMGSNHEKGDQPSIGSLENQLMAMGRVTGMPWENLETDTGNIWKLWRWCQVYPVWHPSWNRYVGATIAGWWGKALPLCKMMDFVSWDDDIPNWIGIRKNMFQTTNQIGFMVDAFEVNVGFTQLFLELGGTTLYSRDMYFDLHDHVQVDLKFDACECIVRWCSMYLDFDLTSFPKTKLAFSIWAPTSQQFVSQMAMPIHTIFRGWTSIYQLFWCSPGGQGFDPSPNNQGCIDNFGRLKIPPFEDVFHGETCGSSRTNNHWELLRNHAGFEMIDVLYILTYFISLFVELLLSGKS